MTAEAEPTALIAMLGIDVLVQGWVARPAFLFASGDR